VDTLRELSVLLFDDLFIDDAVIDKNVVPFDILPFEFVDVMLDLCGDRFEVGNVKGIAVFNG
jgi:hypothetical protein